MLYSEYEMGSEGETLVIPQILTNSGQAGEHSGLGLQVQIGHNILKIFKWKDEHTLTSLSSVVQTDQPVHAAG